nr:MFS transporter [Corynebacterium sp.]
MKVVRGAIVGTVLEYYDFGIYGYMATAIAALFFVSHDDTAALLGTFAAFAVAFFLRIPGGIYFGHIGDKYGRKKALTWTIFLMVVATFVMGLIPTYVTIGVWATIILVLCRCLQGFAAGGELGGANAFVSEQAPLEHRALQTSLVNSGTYLGSLLASLVALVVNSMFDPETILSWAWRIPFLLSVVMGVIGIWIRNHLDETPQFKELEKKGETESIPIAKLLVTSWRDVIVIIFLGGGGHHWRVLHRLGLRRNLLADSRGGHSPTVAFLSTSVALIAGVVTLPISGYLGDRYGRKPILFIGSIGAVLLGFPSFIMMSNGSVWQAFIGQTALFIAVSVVNGCSYVTYVEMLRASVRYSGLALGNNVSNTLLGGTALFIATWLIDVSGSTLAPAAYFVFTALLTLGAVFFVKETRGIELRID